MKNNVNYSVLGLFCFYHHHQFIIILDSSSSAPHPPHHHPHYLHHLHHYNHYHHYNEVKLKFIVQKKKKTCTEIHHDNTEREKQADNMTLDKRYQKNSINANQV